MRSSQRSSSRDPRIDLLRGLALLSIFVDHIPDNRLADFTLHNFGFSDAAELFVFLAGYSATIAYGGVFERDGLRVGLFKVLARCLKIYGVQVFLLLLTLVTVAGWNRFFGMDPTVVAPLLRDGLKGALRGVTLKALPTYLDILPLYIVLLAIFPLVRYGMTRSVRATVAVSLGLWAAANIYHLNLPSFMEEETATPWYFNPFTWQVVFVLGAACAVWKRRETPALARPPKPLLFMCWAYLVFAFLCVDAWKLWPAPFGPAFPGLDAPFAILGNEPKSFVTPWRLLHILAFATVALTSPRLAGVARSRLLDPVAACGRQSLNIFAVGCVLALFGRLIFKTAGVTVATELLVNGAGLLGMLACAALLEWDRARPARRKTPSFPCTSPELTADVRPS